MNQIITLDYIQNEVSNFFKVSPDSLAENTRKREIVKPRQIAMYFARKLKVESDNNICERFGRERSLIFAAIKAVERDIETNVEYSNEIEKLQAIFEKTGEVEVWKPFPLNPIYMVSNFGNVKKLACEVKTSIGTILKFPEIPILAKNKMEIRIQNKLMTMKFPRIVALTWIPNPLNLPCAALINKNRGNIYTNIHWTLKK
jgi:Bacterial dnaA protein helix-turn-helix